jgi:F0F1-type ATP synthase assembly protein I
MALIDSVLNLVNKQPKDPDAPKPPVGSRSEREAKLKDKAGMVISVFALLLAVNSWYGGKLSSTVLNNTLGANNTWAQYQAKAGRGVTYEIAAKTADDPKLKTEFQAEKERMDEDKKELAEKAKAMEADREVAKKSSPWIAYANTAYQLAIVVLSASILAVSIGMFWGSFFVAGVGILLSLNGLYLWF